MAETRTKPTEMAVGEFIARLEDPQKRADSARLIELMETVTGAPPRMWGPTIIGFGAYHYRYASGTEGDSCLAGFSPRKAELSIYLNGTHLPAVEAKRDALLRGLGKHRMGKGCLYVRRLGDIDLAVLEKLVRLSVSELRKAYPDASA